MLAGSPVELPVCSGGVLPAGSPVLVSPPPLTPPTTTLPFMSGCVSEWYDTVPDPPSQVL